MSSTEWHGRGSFQYNPSIHIPLLHEVFANCNGVADFCAEADISHRTFFTWRDKYPEFKEEYEVALSKGAAIWEKKPIEWAKENLKISHKFWEAIQRLRYKHSVVQIEKGGDTTASRMAAAWIAMQTGGITPQEYNQIASGLATESKISELELQKQIVEQLQKSTDENKEVTDEALRAFMLVKSGKGKVILNEQQ